MVLQLVTDSGSSSAIYAASLYLLDKVEVVGTTSLSPLLDQSPILVPANSLRSMCLCSLSPDPGDRDTGKCGVGHLDIVVLSSNCKSSNLDCQI